MRRATQITTRRATIAGTAAALALAASLAARAAVSIQIQACVIGATPLQFGRYDPHQPGGVAGSATVSFRCRLAQPISITLDREAGFGGGYRRLFFGRHTLDYQIYLDPADTMVWGDGTAGSQYYANMAPAPNTIVAVPLYGRIPPAQTHLAAGTYTNRVLVSINF